MSVTGKRSLLALLMGGIIILLSGFGLWYVIGTDAEPDNHAIVFFEKSGDCAIGEYIIGAGTFFDKPSGKNREPAEIQFSSDCSSVYLTTTHQLRAATLSADLGFGSTCTATRADGATDTSRPSPRFKYLITRTGDRTEQCRFWIVLDRVLKRKSLSTYILDVNLGPNADQIGLGNVPGFYATLNSSTRLPYLKSHVVRHRVTIKSDALESWEQALIIILSAIVGVGAALIAEGIILRVMRQT